MNWDSLKTGSGNNGKDKEDRKHPDGDLGEEQLGLFGLQYRQELGTMA